MFERAVEFAKSQGIHKCFETSARTGQNVEEVFSCAGKELFYQAVESSQKEAEELQRMNSSGSNSGGKQGKSGKVNLVTPQPQNKKSDGCKC